MPGDYDNIQDAIYAADAGDIILIAAGTYPAPDGVLVDRGGISIVADGEVVLRDAQGYPRGYFICDPDLNNGQEILFNGLTFVDDNYGIHCLSGGNSHIIVENCIFRGCERGIFAVGEGYVWVRNSIFEDNPGTGFYTIYTGFEVSECVFRNNLVAVKSEDGSSWDPQLLVDCLIVDSAYNGAVAIVYSLLTVRHCTFVNNGQAGYGALHISQADCEVENCIIVSGEGAAFTCAYYDDLFDVSCTNVWNNTEGNWTCGADEGEDGNISADPMFCDPAAEDYTINSESPCAPENNECGTLIGAFPVGCGVTSVVDEDYLPLSVSGLKTCY